MITKHSPESLPEEIRKPLSDIRLSDTSRNRMRAAISAYADMHEVPTHAPISPVRSSYTWTRFRTIYAGALALLLMVATGAQATFASEKAVPGDVLYPVKVSVAEPVALVLARSTEQKAALATDFAARRIDEAVVLHAKGKLDEQTADELAARFDVYVDTAITEAETLEARGAVSASLVARTVLEEKIVRHAEGLTRIAVVEEPVADIATLQTAVTAEIPGIEGMAAKSVAVEEPAPADISSAVTARIVHVDPVASISQKFSARIQEKARLVARVRADAQLTVDAQAPVVAATEEPAGSASATAAVSIPEPVAVVGVDVPLQDVDAAVDTAVLLMRVEGVEEVLSTDTASGSVVAASGTASTTASTTEDGVATGTSVRIEKSIIQKESIVPMLRKLVPFMNP